MPVLCRLRGKHGIVEAPTWQLHWHRDRVAHPGGRILRKTGCLGPLSCVAEARVNMGIGMYQTLPRNRWHIKQRVSRETTSFCKPCSTLSGHRGCLRHFSGCPPLWYENHQEAHLSDSPCGRQPPVGCLFVVPVTNVCHDATKESFSVKPPSYVVLLIVHKSCLRHFSGCPPL